MSGWTVDRGRDGCPVTPSLGVLGAVCSGAFLLITATTNLRKTPRLREAKAKGHEAILRLRIAYFYIDWAHADLCPNYGSPCGSHGRKQSGHSHDECLHVVYEE